MHVDDVLGLGLAISWSDQIHPSGVKVALLRVLQPVAVVHVIDGRTGILNV